MGTHNTHTLCPRCMSCLAKPHSDFIYVDTSIRLSHSHTHTCRTPSLRRSVTSYPVSFRWRAGNHSAFWGMTLDEGIRYRLGTIRPSSSVTSMNEIHVSPFLPTILPFHGLGSQGSWHPVPSSSKGLGYPSPVGCVTLDKSLSFSGPSVLAYTKVCCMRRSSAQILSVVFPARAPSWPPQPGKNAAGPSTAGSGPTGLGGHLGILGREKQTLLQLWPESSNSRKQLSRTPREEGASPFPLSGTLLGETWEPDPG